MSPTDQPSLQELRSLVAEEMARQEFRAFPLSDQRELARRISIDMLQKQAVESIGSGFPPMSPLHEQQMAQQVVDALFGLGKLQQLVDDPMIENIDVNGFDQVWVTTADGAKLQVDPIAGSDRELVEILMGAAARFGLSEHRFDVGRPELDLALPDGSRLSALMSVSRRPVVSIRRHRFVSLSLADLVDLGSIDVDLASFLSAAVKARKNIVVAGAMNSGKTTLLRALSAEIPPRERIVTIEQAFELGIDSDPDRHPDLVALESREANAEGEGRISTARLVRRSLRMNADRVIVGEVLGDEVLPMLNAMSQGRSGSMCTIHADSSEGVFRRLASYAVQAPERLPIESTNQLIAGAVHFVVFMDVSDEIPEEDESPPVFHRRFDVEDMEQALIQSGVNPSNQRASFPPMMRKRFVSSVREVVDAEGIQVVSNEIYAKSEGSTATRGAPIRSSTMAELERFGYSRQPPLPIGQSWSTTW